MTNLISGKEALIALANGEVVEYEAVVGRVWNTISSMSVNLILNDNFRFRLKPRTITLNVEIPAPFKPKDGEEAWCLDGNTLDGYKKVICDDFIDSGIGFWRTEEEIKQVVAVLSQVFGGVK